MYPASSIIQKIVLSLSLAFALPVYGVPVTQISPADTLGYDVVVVDTKSLVELMATSTGKAIPISTLTDIEMVSCVSGKTCVNEVFTDSAGRITSSVLAIINTLPTSVAFSATETGIESSGTVGTVVTSGHLVSATSNAPIQGKPNESMSASGNASSQLTSSTGTLLVQSATSDAVSGPLRSTTTSIGSRGRGTGTSTTNDSGDHTPPASTSITAFTVAGSLSATNKGLGSSSVLTSVATTTPSLTSAVTFALEITNSQGSVTDEVIEVGYNSGVASTTALFAFADRVTTTETSPPAGVSIQTIPSPTCVTAGDIVTTTSFGSTVPTEVPKLCTHGFAFLIFGLPGFHSSSRLSSLCHKVFLFPFGIMWRVFCPPKFPPIISIISIDPGKLPSGVSDHPNDQNPTETQRATSDTPSQTTQTQTTQSTVSSAATATQTRYVVMPLMNTTQSATDLVFAAFAQRENVTQAKGSDGSLKFFALELNETEASTIDANPNFIVIEESGLEIGMPDTGETDPDLLGTGYFDSKPTVRSRDLHGGEKPSKGGGLFRRIPLQSWAVKFASWSLAMISLAPGIPLPDYSINGDDGNVYYYVDEIEPGTNVRVYLLDTGLNMQHPEFDGRLKPGIRRGQHQDDWDIDWLFPGVDDLEVFPTPGPRGSTRFHRYSYNYIDPNSPNPNGGIHPAYSDFRKDQAQYANMNGKLTPHGTRLSAFIIGDTLGQAQNCRYTVVKLPQYTNGPLSQQFLFPLFSIRDAIGLIGQDIEERKAQGEENFVISSACGVLFANEPGHFPVSRERGYKKMWRNFLYWLDENEVTICASAGNARRYNPEIELIPARLFRDPQIVVGSVTSNALAHPGSQGSIGDRILTAYAPAAGARVVSSDAAGNYGYEFFDPGVSAVTSYACGMTVGYIAQMIALGYTGNAVILPRPDEAPNEYAYRMVSTESKPRVAGGPPIIYNNAPAELYQDCEVPGGHRKRDGSCPLTQTGLTASTEALSSPLSSSTGTTEGPGQTRESLDGSSRTSSAEGTAGHTSSTLSTSAATTGTVTASCYHTADPQNTCTAIAHGPGWCVCGDSPASYAVQTGTDPACGWTTLLPPITSFDCPTVTTTLVSTSTSSATSVTPASSTPSPSPLNAGIAIWLQQYSSPSGAQVDTWFAYSYTPAGDAKLGDPCDANPRGTAPVPDGTPVAEETALYPVDMAISAYGRKLRYTSVFDHWVGDLTDGDTGKVVALCTALLMMDDAKSVTCGAQYLLIPRLTCEWAN